MIQPTAEDVRAAREAAGLTQTEAAAAIGMKLRGWQYYESGERKMRPLLYEAFLAKTRR